MKRIIFCIALAVPHSSLLQAQAPEDQFVNLTIGLPMHEIVWDPHEVSHVTEHRLLSALYEGLVGMDSNTMLPTAALAEKWNVSNDGLTYTFYLRENLRFSDGSYITASSFYRSFLRLIDPVSARANAELLYAVKNVRAYSGGESIAREDLGFQVVDERTLVITLEHPAPYFLEILSHPALSPISQSQLPAVWDKPMMVVYSGPYLVGAVGENGVTLKRNHLYWDVTSVETKEIEVHFYDNAFEATEHFNKEQVDWVNSLFDPNAVARNKVIQYTKLYASQYYFFTQQEGMYANALLQQALVQLLPLHYLREAQRIGLETLTPTIPNYPSAQSLRTDPVEAYLTLADLGFPRGRGLAPITILAFDRDDEVAQVMADVWRSSLDGVEVSVVYSTTADQIPATVMSVKWLADYLDPLAFLSQWRSDARLNQSTFHNSEFDHLLDISHQQEGKERFETLSASEALLLQSGVVIPVASLLEFNLIDFTQVKGFSFNPLGRQSFKKMQLIRPALDEQGLLV
jgi:oligopeptide transport system substrate-binding protein